MHIISIPIAFVAGVALLALCVPVVARAVRSRKRPQFSLGRLMLMMLSCAVLLFAGVRWLCVDCYLAMAAPWMAAQSSGAAPRYASLPEEQELMVLNYALRNLALRRDRVAAIKILCQLHPNDALDALLQHAHEDSEPEIKAIELRLIGLFRRRDTIDFLLERLRDKQPEVRAAAVDALGIIHEAAYPILAHTIDSPCFNSDPPIDISEIVPMGLHPDISVPSNREHLLPEVRDALEGVMLNGATSGEREAAALALLKWPPDKYKLRLTEWGVWLADAGELKLLQSQLDEIPPFVHSTGNPCHSLRDRIPSRIIEFNFKPVVQLTASAPMAVDLEVNLNHGRPWYAYPMPDDFGISIESIYRPYKGNPAAHADFLAPLDNAQLEPLKNLREGYPWLSPSHRTSVPVTAATGFPNSEIVSMGLHWQSVIVSPQQPAWMQPPDCGTDKKFKWWSDLRSVPCSWVSNRGESERFLYYDGPTLALAPVKVSRVPDMLTFSQQAMFPGPKDTHLKKPALPPGKPRRGMLIQCNGPATASALTVTVPESHGSIQTFEFEQTTAAACEEKFVSLLVEQGLTREEARGMADCWTTQFFHTGGTRFIYFLSPDEYNETNPIQVHPAPTEMVRVGVVLTEF